MINYDNNKLASFNAHSNYSRIMDIHIYER